MAESTAQYDITEDGVELTDITEGKSGPKDDFELVNDDTTHETHSSESKKGTKTEARVVAHLEELFENKQHTFYKIEISRNGTSQFVKRRYSELLLLHKWICLAFPNVTFPTFPGGLFENKSNRYEQLRTWLDAVSQDFIVPNSFEFLNFFEVEEENFSENPDGPTSGTLGVHIIGIHGLAGEFEDIFCQFTQSRPICLELLNDDFGPVPRPTKINTDKITGPTKNPEFHSSFQFNVVNTKAPIRLSVYSGSKPLGFVMLHPTVATSQNKDFWLELVGHQGVAPVSGSIQLQLQFKGGIHDLKTIAVSKKQDKAVIQIEKKVFFPGEQVAGCATFQLNSTDVEKIISCRIAIKGTQFVHWSSGKHSHSKTSTVLDQTLLNVMQAEGFFTPGVRNVNFSQPIPIDIPPTMAFTTTDSGRAWIRYSVNLYLKSKRALGTSLKTIKIPVVVKGNMPSPALAVPAMYHRSDNVLFRKDQVGKLEVRFDQKYITPGESIKAHVRLHNNTNYTATSIKVTLNTVRKMRMSPKSWTNKTHNKSLWKNEAKCRCEPSQVLDISVPFTLPVSCPIPTIDSPRNSPLIMVKYNVKVVASFEGLLVSNVAATMPITVCSAVPKGYNM